MTKNRGFTLIETVVYIVILGMLFTVIVTAVVNVISLYHVFDVRRDIQDSALASFDRITREIRSARSVSTSGSVFNSHPGILVVSTNQGGVPIVRQFSLDNGVLHLYEEGVDQGPLTSADVTVTNLVFEYSENEHTDLVKITMQLQAGNGDIQETKNFYVSTVLRGSYND